MKKTLPLVLAAVLLCSSGCAVLNKDNLRAFTWLDRTLVPESKALKVALLPVFIPLGLCALCVDQFILHPVSVIDDAIEDTVDAYWQRDWKGCYALRCAALPWYVALTPVTFTADWLLRCIFDIPHNNKYAWRDPP
jgi:hypothetical protein